MYQDTTWSNTAWAGYGVKSELIRLNTIYVLTILYDNEI